MLKKTLLTAVCLASFCYADNFIIDSIQQGGGEKKQSAHQESEQVAEHPQEKLPQRIVVEDINPSSELGQLVGTMLKNEQKKAVVAAKPKPKPVAKKKTTKKKTAAKKKVAKKSVAKKDVVMEIKSEEALKVDENQKKEAEHNENNSSLKKVSSSSACD